MRFPLPIGIVALSVLLPATPAPARPPPPPRTAEQETRAEADLETLLRWLLAPEREGELVTLPWPAVVRAATGHRVLPFDPKDPTDAAVMGKISPALNGVLRAMNGVGSPARDVERVNEVSRFFEDAIQGALNTLPGLRCEFAPNAAGNVQRSGYPDLRVTEAASGKVYYLDPKLFAEGSRGSTFRSFYFEPRTETSKVTTDAVHLVVGIEHNGEPGEKLRFTRWEIVDCATLKVRLKAEFQANNRDVYRDVAVVARGVGAEK